MILGPGCSQPCPRCLQDIIGALTQPAGGLIDHRLGVIQMDFPATTVRELGELLAIHDRVSPGLIGRATLDGDVVREVKRSGPKRDRQNRRGQRGCELIETPALVVDRCGRHAWFDQLNPTAVDDLVIRSRRDRNGPAEMIRNRQTHAGQLVHAAVA